MAAGAANQPSGSPVPGLMGAPDGDTTEHGRRTAQDAPSWALWRKKRPYLAHTAPLMLALISTGPCLKRRPAGPWDAPAGSLGEMAAEVPACPWKGSPCLWPFSASRKAPSGKGRGQMPKGLFRHTSGDSLFRKPSMKGLPGDSCILTSGAGTRSPERRYL